MRLSWKVSSKNKQQFAPPAVVLNCASNCLIVHFDLLQTVLNNNLTVSDEVTKIVVHTVLDLNKKFCIIDTSFLSILSMQEQLRREYKLKFK